MIASIFVISRLNRIAIYIHLIYSYSVLLMRQFDTAKFPQKVIGLPNRPGTKLPIKKAYVTTIDVLLTFLWRITTFNLTGQLYSLNILIFVTM